jgi:hypothetical protein
VLAAGVLLLGLIGVIIVAALFLLGLFGTPQGESGVVLTAQIPLETVAARRQLEEARLNSYRWVDQEAGVVNIPISQAMILIAASNLPVGEPTATPTPTVTPTPAVTPTPEAGPTATPVPTVDLANVSFTHNVLPIFEEHCTRCHGGDNPEQGLRLTTPAEVLAGSVNGSVVEPGDVENSYLIEQIVTGRMPKEGPKLTPAEIEIITAWVEQGALDN